MTKFFAAFGAETTKLLKGKGLKILLIMFVIYFIIIAVAFSLISSIDLEKLIGQEGLPTDVDQGIFLYKAQLAEYDLLYTQGAFSKLPLNTTRDSIEAKLTLYTYLKANNLSVDSVHIYSTMSMLYQSKQAIGFMRLFLSGATQLMIFYVICMASASIAGEGKEGMLKLSLLRPIRRRTMLFAKTSAIFSTAIVSLIGVSILSSVFAMCFYDLSSLPSIVITDRVFAASMSGFATYAMEFALSSVTILAMLSLTTFLATLFANKNAATALPIIAFLMSSLLMQLGGLLYIGYGGFITNLSFATCLGIEGGVLKGQSFIVGICVTFVYIAAFLSSSALLFSKKDIN